MHWFREVRIAGYLTRYELECQAYERRHMALLPSPDGIVTAVCWGVGQIVEQPVVTMPVPDTDEP